MDNDNISFFGGKVLKCVSKLEASASLVSNQSKRSDIEVATGNTLKAALRSAEVIPFGY